jgi:hypothetical protein
MMLEKFAELSSQVKALGENIDKLGTSLLGEIQSIKDFLRQGD